MILFIYILAYLLIGLIVKSFTDIEDGSIVLFWPIFLAIGLVVFLTTGIQWAFGPGIIQFFEWIKKVTRDDTEDSDT